MKLTLTSALAAVCIFILASCDSEERNPHVLPPAAAPAEETPLTTFQPGVQTPQKQMRNPYSENAYALSEGKRLFSNYNCSGCHSNGGGGMGPALMDDRWLYGSNPDQIYSTIVGGRPNGMPSFRGRIPEYQVWELVAYVRSLGGLTSTNPAPGRNDDLNGPPPEHSRKAQTPHQSFVPKSAEAPQ